MKASGYKACLGFLLLLQVVARGQTKEVYELNDPRNPNCPCHQYQQQAEKEYAQNKRMEQQGSEFNASKKVDVPAGSRMEHEPRVMPVNKGGGTRLTKSGKKKQFMLKQRFRVMNQLKRRKKVKPNYAVCYRW